MENKTKQGNTMVIVIIVVVAVAIIGYLIYDNNQKKQAEADAQVQQAQQQQMAAEKQAADTEAAAMAQQKEAEDTVANAQAEVAAGQAAAQETAEATCEEELATATKLLPGLQEYSDLLKNIGEDINDDPDKAVEKCREIYADRGLSKNECQIKVDDFVAGKTAVYDELQVEIAATEATIAAGC